ncbi:DMT family transporter [Geobacter sp. DSM 9736]|uniref:DMT family transporter n=1 Tax=Geobacter sp. DSM 9736 TaxID=1277350 RepID=UPI000B505F65|nr:DMT family transporter [Geobacter sp. DSM 9736]
MSSLAFMLVVFSGLMHALYNLLIKRSQNKTVFIWWLFLVSSGLLLAILPLLPGVPRFEPQALVLAGAGAACFVLYHLCTGHAYRRGDLSVTYPLTQTSMLYVPLWGVCFLGERPAPFGIIGIILVALGAYLTQMRRLRRAELLRPFRNLADHSILAAILAGFIYSVGAIIDKKGVENYSPLSFTSLLIFTMLGFMTANLLRPCHRPQIFAEWRQNRWYILAGGPLMAGSFLTFRYGLSLAPLAYAVPVRQVSVIAGVLIGVLFLGEPCGRIRLLAAALIVTGVCLIRLG